MSRSFRSLSRQPNGVKVIAIFKNLALLCFRQPTAFINQIIEDMLQMSEGALRAKSGVELVSVPKVSSVPELSKQQYIAIVGVNTIPTKVVHEIARELGLNKSNIRIYDDVSGFKSGKYTDSLQSSNCVAIVFGAIPHSHNGNSESEYREKAIYARNNSSAHGKLKLTKSTLKPALQKALEKVQLSNPIKHT